MKKHQKTQNRKREQIAQTLVATANIFKVSVRTISTWKAEGREEAGFRADGTVCIRQLRAWRAQRQRIRRCDPDLLEQKIRKLKIANDRTESSLISREFMRNACESMIADIKPRIPSIIDGHVKRFPSTEAAGVESNRKVLQEIWDYISEKLQELSDNFKAP
jgi:phage terminase Nu1 subunit (DNA packaging protein)